MRSASATVCHARGSNAGLPPVWLIYITVASLEESLRRCEASGGKVRIPPHSFGSQGRYAVIEDPAGAVAALFEPS
jgi:predicted enzyme related to lactoylglutathione lyase